MRAPLPPESLRWTVPEGALPFAHTGELQPLEELVGQDRARGVLARAVSMENPGYNIFITGMAGGGRLRTVGRVLERLRPRRRCRRDLVYVQNLEDPSRPKLLVLTAGMGPRFQAEMADLLRDLYEEIPRVLDSEPVRRSRDARVRQSERAQWSGIAALQEDVEREGFAIVQEQSEGELRFNIAFEVEGEPQTRGELLRLEREGKLTRPVADIEARLDALEDRLADLVARARRDALVASREISAFERRAVGDGVRPLFDTLARRFPRARRWLTELAEATAARMDLFQEGAPTQSDTQRTSPGAALLGAFVVNVFHRGSPSRLAPVVLVSDPTWRTLFGGIEIDPMGLVSSDHSHLRAGALLDADGGFLVCDASDLLAEPESWRGLGRALRFGEQPLRNPEGAGGGATPLRPDAVPLDVKVVLIGTAAQHHLLNLLDPDFASTFKAKVEFDEVVDYSDEVAVGVARVLRRLTERERLPHVSREAVAELLAWASREAGRGGRLRLAFGDLADVVREAAALRRTPVLSAEDLRAALDARADAGGQAARRMADSLRRDILHVDTDGAVVGQVNGLAVMRFGGFTFGRPLRITGSVGTGRGGFIDVEREAGLAGRSRNKAHQVIAGFLRARFGRTRTLALTASVCCEQSYGPIDGDSASVADLCVLISALAQVGLLQGRAVTGSVDQLGRVQPVGGVNDKIEGFFDLCAARGFTGQQGVIIPSRNAVDLALKAEVVRACAEGSFSIWAVETVEEVFALLTGVPVGDPADAAWGPDLLYGKVVAALEELERVVRQASKGPEKKESLRPEEGERGRSRRGAAPPTQDKSGD